MVHHMGRRGPGYARNQRMAGLAEIAKLPQLVILDHHGCRLKPDLFERMRVNERKYHFECQGT